MKLKSTKSNNSSAKWGGYATKHDLVRRLNALTSGLSVEVPGYGVVKCTKAASQTKCRRRKFSVSGSKVAANRNGYSFTELVKAFGLRG